jgi:hypothetical protein
VTILRTCVKCGAAYTPGEPCPRCAGANQHARACLTCGRPTLNGNYCPDHEHLLEQERNARRVHYHGDYKTRAARLRARADADPTTRCAICGGLKRSGRGGRWTAHHVDAGNPDSELAPAHADCNERLGNRTNPPNS